MYLVKLQWRSSKFFLRYTARPRSRMELVIGREMLVIGREMLVIGLLDQVIGRESCYWTGSCGFRTGDVFFDEFEYNMERFFSITW